MARILAQPDETVTAIAAALEEFEDQYPGTECALYRYNPGAVRVRVVSPIFEGVSKRERQNIVMKTLRKLPGDTRYDISIMLCLAPGETSMMDVEFEEPVPTDM